MVANKKKWYSRAANHTQFFLTDDKYYSLVRETTPKQRVPPTIMIQKFDSVVRNGGVRTNKTIYSTAEARCGHSTLECAKGKARHHSQQQIGILLLLLLVVNHLLIIVYRNTKFFISFREKKIWNNSALQQFLFDMTDELMFILCLIQISITFRLSKISVWKF